MLLYSFKSVRLWQKKKNSDMLHQLIVKTMMTLMMRKRTRKMRVRTICKSRSREHSNRAIWPSLAAVSEMQSTLSTLRRLTIISKSLCQLIISSWYKVLWRLGTSITQWLRSGSHNNLCAAALTTVSLSTRLMETAFSLDTKSWMKSLS